MLICDRSQIADRETITRRIALEIEMAKKKAGGDPRKEVKRLDREILKLINQRAKVWQSVADSAERGPAELAASIEKLTATTVGLNRGPLSERTVSTIFRELHSGCSALVKNRRIGFLGPEQSDSYLAAAQQFGSTLELIPLTTIEAVFEEVLHGKAEFGVVPWDDSIDGRIADTLTTFANTALKICGEIRCTVHHCLLTKGDRSTVKQICGSPRALLQCHDWLTKHFPLVQQISLANAAAAVRLAGESESVAAIASERAAVAHGLSMIAANIEDKPMTSSRFAVIGNEAAKRTGRDKTALMFEIQDQTGALVDVLNVFKRAKLNLTRIESLPSPDSLNEHLCCVEIEGHQVDARVRKALISLKTKTTRMVVLGSFPVE